MNGKCETCDAPTDHILEQRDLAGAVVWRRWICLPCLGLVRAALDAQQKEFDAGNTGGL